MRPILCTHRKAKGGGMRGRERPEALYIFPGFQHEVKAALNKTRSVGQARPAAWSLRDISETSTQGNETSLRDKFRTHVRRKPSY